MKPLYAIFLFIFIFLGIGISCAQESDTLYLQGQDTLSVVADSADQIDDDVVIIYKAAADSVSVEKRPFDSEKLNRLKSDPDLDYKVAPTVAESLWDRFLMWLGEIINAIFKNAVGTDWGRVIVYIIGLALFVVLIMMILKVNAFKVFYSGTGTTQKYQVLDENIHEMDFDKLIQEAMDQQDYRRGIRLLFLYALKLLSDRQLIHFESGKTNHDYVGELTKNELKTGLNELSFYFDYAWYGNFQINRDTFSKAQNIFNDWKNRLT